MLEQHVIEYDDILDKMAAKAREDNYTIIKTALGGSYAYGLNHQDSDLDVRGIFAHEPSKLLGLEKLSDEIEVEGSDAKWYELAKFVRLTAKGNPATMELLYSDALRENYLLNELIVNQRENKRFLGKDAIYAAYGGVARANAKATESMTPERAYKTWKHTFRLLVQGEHLLLEGELKVKLEVTTRDFLHFIGTGVYNQDELLMLFGEFYPQFTMAYEKSKLPENANFDKLNWMVKTIRKDMWQ